MNNEMKNNDNTKTFRVKRNKVMKNTRTLQELLFTELEKFVLDYIQVEYVDEGRIFPEEDYEDKEEELDNLINDLFESGLINFTNPVLQELQDDLLNVRIYHNNFIKEGERYELTLKELLEQVSHFFIQDNRDWLYNLCYNYFNENILK